MTASFNTHLHPAGWPHGTLDYLLTLLCLFLPLFCQYFPPTSYAWSNAYPLPMLQGPVEVLPSLKLCGVSPFILPWFTVCASLSPSILSKLERAGCHPLISSWEVPSSCADRCSIYTLNPKAGAWWENRAKGALEAIIQALVVGIRKGKLPIHLLLEEFTL